MITIITNTSRFSLLIFLALYTLIAFLGLRSGTKPKRRRRYYFYQNFLTFLFLADANIVLFANTENFQYLLSLLMECILVLAIQIAYSQIYPDFEPSLINFMTIFLSIGLVIQSRLSVDRFMHQYLIAIAGLIISLIVPTVVLKIKDLSRYQYLYAAVGITLLLIVFLIGSREYGAKLSISLGSISFQPTEFVKLLYVLFLASAFSKLEQKASFKLFFLTIILAGIHLLILVGSRDLGAVAILFIIFVSMFYVWTGNVLILFSGFGAVAVGVVLLSTVFSHVSERLMAWLDPLAYVEDQGYQLSQSLFAISGGGWFGSGLTQGMPEKIPVVAKDFIFAAICEEFGVLFAICLLLLCVACFLMMMNVGMKSRRVFHKLLAVGLGTIYGVQLLLSVGGVIRFIPSTGVTFPFISYGGSSLIATMILFALLEGIHLKEGELRDAEK